MKSSIPFIITIVVLAAFTFIPKEDDFIGRLKANVENYNKKYEPVSLHLNFNQPYYAIGDTISFQALYFSLANQALITPKQIANLEVYDEKGNKIADEKFVLKQGTAGVELALPSSIKPGFYTIVAYTDWMKNFGTKNYFTKTIRIVDQNRVTAQTIPAEFFPEGGHLISGMENNVYVKIPSGLGKISAKLKNGSDIVTEVNFSSEGWAKMTFAPAPGIRYTLDILGEASTSVPLPSTESSGISLRLIQDSEKTVAKLFFTPDIVSSAKNYYLTVINPSTIAYHTKLDQSRIAQEVVIGPRQLTAHSVIAIISDDGKVWATEQAYPNTKILRTDVALSKTEFAVRDSINATVGLADDLGAVNGIFSASVFNANLFGIQPGGNAQNTNSVKPSFDWMNWEMILSGTIKEPVYKTLQYLTIDGDAFFAESNKPVADSTLLMFYFEKQIIGYEVYASNGKFHVPVFFDFSEPDMVYYAASRRGKDLKGVTIKLKSEDDKPYPAPQMSSTVSSDADSYGSFRTKTKLIGSSFQYFSSKKAAGNIDPNFAIEDELGGADVVVNLKDYLVFPTMAEVVKEVLPSVEHRKIGGQDMIKMYTTHKRPVNNAEPVYVIDGVITKSTETFLSLNPADVLTLKVIKNGGKLIRLGKLFDNGVILVRTSNNAGLKINRENIFPLRGLLPATTSSKKIRLGSKNIPSFAPTLFWKPVTKVEGSPARLGFSASDDVGDFVIQIQGIASDGRPIDRTQGFRVALPRQ